MFLLVVGGCGLFFWWWWLAQHLPDHLQKQPPPRSPNIVIGHTLCGPPPPPPPSFSGPARVAPTHYPFNAFCGLPKLHTPHSRFVLTFFMQGVLFLGSATCFFSREMLSHVPPLFPPAYSFLHSTPPPPILGLWPSLSPLDRRVFFFFFFVHSFSRYSFGTPFFFFLRSLFHIHPPQGPIHLHLVSSVPPPTLPLSPRFFSLAALKLFFFPHCRRSVLFPEVFFLCRFCPRFCYDHFSLPLESFSLGSTDSLLVFYPVGCANSCVISQTPTTYLVSCFNSPYPSPRCF